VLQDPAETVAAFNIGLMPVHETRECLEEELEEAVSRPTSGHPTPLKMLVVASDTARFYLWIGRRSP
jgi:hypothetical protein